MGASLSWLAVRGKSPQVVRTELGLRPAGRREHYPKSPVTAAELPGGWYLLVENHRLKNQYVRDSVLKNLSLGCEVITCAVEEHVMCSEAAAWNNGFKTWSVSHDSGRGDQDLRTEGEMPPAFATIRDRLVAAPAGEVDYLFEIPVELAGTFTNFRYDDCVSQSDNAAFEVFVSRKSVLKIILKGIALLLIPVIVSLLAPLFYLRTISKELPKGVRDSPRRNLWELVFVLFCLGSWLFFSLRLFQLIWFFHRKMYPTHQLHDFWREHISTRSFIPSFLMVFAPIPGGMAVAFLTRSLLAWFLVPPLRRIFQTASPKQPGKIYWQATRRTAKFALLTFFVGMSIALIAASLLKSLR